MVRPPLRLLRVANPVVRGVLGSPAHRLLSGSLVVLEYRGSRSGRTFRIPLRYALSGDSVVAIAVGSERKLWWRSFRTPRRVVLLLRGRDIHAVGALVEGAARERGLASYLARFPRSAGVARDAAVVVFEPAD